MMMMMMMMMMMTMMTMMMMMIMMMMMMMMMMTMMMMMMIMHERGQNKRRKTDGRVSKGGKLQLQQQTACLSAFLTDHHLG
eukprot:COSAG06_NODE_10536_length_1663_cov_1580.142583_3_plen_81_part_00